MLKVFLGFVVSVVVLLSSAYVPQVIPRAYAASASVLITQIQAGGIGAATKEFIVIYNNSPDEVDISGWCLTNKNNVKIGCFSIPSDGKTLYLPPYKHAVVVSTALGVTLPSGTVTATYVPISQSSGSITAGSDTISLIDQIGMVVDRHTWTVAITAGMQFERRGSGSPLLYTNTDILSDWSITTSAHLPVDETEMYTTVVDLCPNINGVQLMVPTGNEVNNEGECVNQTKVQLLITEVLPNAVGTDDGQEFIELYNPNDIPIDLANYRLHVGSKYENMYNFPTSSIIPAHGYLSFSNASIPFTLLNTSSLVRLTTRSGDVISEISAYTSPKDGESWALIGGSWQYTNRPTPGLANLTDLLTVTALPHLATTTGDNTKSVVTDTVSTLRACAANQYRNLETNRCRLLTTQAVTVTACKIGQYRSEETNRCRNIATDAKVVTLCSEGEERNPTTQRCRKIVSASEPAACKEGQERSLDTNRCRTVTKMPSADYGVLGAETKSGGNWYALAAVGAVLLLALGYAIWEWHDEMGKFFRKYYERALRFARIRK